MKANRDSGQGALEYIGILAVVVVVVGFVMAAFRATSGDISDGVEGLVTSILSGGEAG
jgi:hypothetical protein